jgi:hypothetical protein
MEVIMTKGKEEKLNLYSNNPYQIQTNDFVLRNWPNLLIKLQHTYFKIQTFD